MPRLFSPNSTRAPYAAPQHEKKNLSLPINGIVDNFTGNYHNPTDNKQHTGSHINIMKRTIAAITFCICCAMAAGQNLTHEIEKIIRGKQATIGAAVIYGNHTFLVGNTQESPKMSVFKLHIGITAQKKMEAENIPLDSMVYIEKEQMSENTYSPLRNKFPDQRIHISFRSILEYTISHSDNNTCDWLIAFVGGIDKVDRYIKSLGIEDLNLTHTESEMHADIMKCYDNCSTPLSVAQLLKAVYTENIPCKEHFVFLEKTLLNCSSGKDKLIAGLPAGVEFAHKTGHSDRTPEGILICDADAGVIYMPDGKKCYISVLIKDSKEYDAENARIMARIAAATYKCLTKRRH